MPLPELPLELYDAVLSQIDEDALAQTTLSLMRAMPRAPIPLKFLFEHIRLRQSQQVVQFDRRLRQKGATHVAHLVKDIRFEAWDADTEVVANVLTQLEEPTTLVLFVGPYVAPETLLGMFKKPWAKLEKLTLRFRPYVQRVNYLQFLKGAYFDSTIVAISEWPSCGLKSLSIVQDPLIDRTPFAQPLVFFSLHPLAGLSTSDAMKNVHSLRIRIPGRNIAPLIGVAHVRFPALISLDLSTGRIQSNDLTQVLTRFPYIHHLRLDKCSTHFTHHGDAADHGFDAQGESEFTRLGRTCALAGVKRAREREKEVRTAREAHALGAGGDIGGQQQRPRPRAGRRGLATATISLRGANDVGSLAEPAVAVLPGSQSLMAPLVENLGLGEEQMQARTSTKLRVAPVPPLLRTLCMTVRSTPTTDGAGGGLANVITNADAVDLPPSPEPTPGPSSRGGSIAATAQHTQFQIEFECGWDEGIATLRATWARLRTSERAGIAHVVVFKDAMGVHLDERGNVGAQDMMHLDDAGWDALENRPGGWPCPRLCLAGEEAKANTGLHASGCGHEATAEGWADCMNEGV